MASDNIVQNRNGFLSIIIRIIVNAVVLMIVSYLTPGFSVANFWTALLAAVVIAVLDYFIQRIFKIDASPFGRGIAGFLVAALIIYLTQFIVAGVSVSMWGAVIGALIIGLIDLIVPGRIM